MKKVLCLICILVFGITCFTGCGKGSVDIEVPKEVTVVEKSVGIIDVSNLSLVNTDGVEVADNIVTIKGGSELKYEYDLYGFSDNVQIVVDAPNCEIVLCVSDSLEMSNVGTVISVLNASKFSINTKADASFKDIKEYLSEDEIKSVIDIASETVISGEYPIKVESMYGNGIYSSEDILKSLNPDIFVTASYGQIIKQNILDLPKYKLGEELMNSISHGIGGALSIAALILCIIKSDSGLDLLSSLFYGISSIILYVMSCLYHSLARNNAKRVFRIIDHCSIFLLIAGTYTPFCLCVLPLNIGWWIFGFVWGCAVLGILLNSLDMKKFKKISMVLYLVMGWCIIVTFKPLWENMNHFGIMLLLLGGVTYTVGAVLYGVGKKKQYMHSMFHIFCLIASVCFFLAIYIYAL